MFDDLRLYAHNWCLWWQICGIRWRYLLENPLNWRAYFLLFIYHGIDVMVNTLTGGDGRESLSIRFFRQRNAGKFWGFMSHIANFLFHDDGPSPEGDFRGQFQLSVAGQIAVTVFSSLLLFTAYTMLTRAWGALGF